MLTYPNIDPVAFSLGPLTVHWYGIMYLVGFALAWWLGRLRAKRPGSGWSAEQVSDLIFYGALGVVLGGRLGYVLFYNFNAFLAEPLILFKVWQGGMSFHGGLLGVIIGMWLFARRHQKPFFGVADFAAPLTPLGLFAGRIANFINGELWGKPTDAPWGMVIAPGAEARHPSQLYEAFLEGIVLFAILWVFTRKPRPMMTVSGMFLLFYGLFRFVVEFVRLPDEHIGYLAFGWVTMGQVLSLPMILFGLGLIWYGYQTKGRPGIAETGKKTKTSPSK